MRLRKIEGFSQNGVKSHFINKRLEFFHHYWTFLLDDKRFRTTLLSDIKFESHRSLLIKLRLALEADNIKRAKKKASYYFVHNEYFRKDNIVLRQNKPIRELIRKTNALVQSEKSSSEEILQSISKVEQSILYNPDYPTTLANILIRMLHVDKPLNELSLSDMKFLINSFIVELYYCGHSLQYLKKLPDILLLNKQQSQFPYERDISDFEFDRQSFDDYVKEERTNWTLEKMLKGLSTLAKRPPIKGFYVFKVNGIEYALEHPINLWGCEVYNPKVSPKGLLLEADRYFNEQIKNCELFIENIEYEDEGSTCNILVPTEFHPIWDLSYPDRSLFKAFEIGKSILAVLNDLRNKHDIIPNFAEGHISLRDHILLHSNFKPAYTRLLYYKSGTNAKFSMGWSDKTFEVEVLQEYINRLNDLDPKNEFHSSVIKIVTILREVENSPEKFSFSKLWVNCIESILSQENELREIKAFIFLCLKRRLNLQFLNNSKGFLSFTLSDYKGFTTDPVSYFLSDQECSQFDLLLNVGDYIVAQDKFVTNYKGILRSLDIDFLLLSSG